MGRKKKFVEGTTQLGLVVPPTMADIIKAEAAEQQVSVNEYLNNILATYDKELAKSATKEIVALREELKRNREEIEVLNEKLDNYSAKGKSMSEYISSELEEDPLLKEALTKAEKQYGDKVRRILSNPENSRTAADPVIEDAYRVVETAYIDKNRFIKQKKMVLARLKRKLCTGE